MECEEMAACSRYKSEDQGFENMYSFNWYEALLLTGLSDYSLFRKLNVLNTPFGLFILEINHAVFVFKAIFAIRGVTDIAGAWAFKNILRSLGRNWKRNPMIEVDGHSLFIPAHICAGLEKRVKIQQAVRNLTVFKLLQLLLQLGLC